MTARKLDPKTRNNDIGLYFGRSRRVVIDQTFGEMASWIKANVGGDIVWKNSITGEIGIWNLEDGEAAPIVCDMILTSGTVGGTLETTSATGMLWASTPADLGSLYEY